MNYKQTLDYLYAQLPMYHRVGASAYKANLDNTLSLCNLAGNPQDSFKAVHITGTNGKGSVSHMLASVLQAAGYRTGLYTSPHLRDFRERIRVDGKMIQRSYVTSFIRKFRNDYEKFQPSFFELTVGMAFSYFRDMQVDIAVVEVGLGGRLDSTNIIIPELSVITNVSLDHMQFLGDTCEKIAIEKAGIIKPGIPVVIGETQEDIRHVYLNKATECESHILFADQQFHVEPSKISEISDKTKHLTLYNADHEKLMKIELPLKGNYQHKNVVTVMGAVVMLRVAGFQISDKIFRQGLKGVIRNTGFMGRWQILGKRRNVICDTGHNEGGIREVVKQLSEISYRRLHFVFGTVNDKSLEKILTLLPSSARYYFCRPDIPRGLDAGLLQTHAREFGLQGEVYPSVGSAFKSALGNAHEDDLVFVGGSNFVVAEVI
jgi:dihydrofolate synthase/folylpolyglutamate synthase